MTLDPAVAAVRLAVRRGLADVAGQPVLVACSGGADSLALVAATVSEGRTRGWTVVGVTVDHALQQASADRADRVVAQMSGLGVDETATIRVSVEATGQGPEAAAREARYAALAELAERFGGPAVPPVVLLGHTLDDQAETVLLGLTRGSGGRSLAGMRRSFGVFRRPLLDVTRAETVAACLAEGIEVWTDPHNTDDRFTRVRVRSTVLPLLEAELGPGVARALARTADQLRTDTGFLDAVADAGLAEATLDDDDDGGLAVDRLAAMHEAVRRRVLRLAALAAGAIPAELFHEHVVAVDRLVTHWHGQKSIDLPGHLRAVRVDGVIRFEPS